MGVTCLTPPHLPPPPPPQSSAEPCTPCPASGTSSTWNPPTAGYGAPGNGGGGGAPVDPPVHPRWGWGGGTLSVLYVVSHLCPAPPQLSLRAVNSSRSAFASFLFAPLFFQLYEARGPPPHLELCRCKVLMKVQHPARSSIPHPPTPKISPFFWGGGTRQGDPLPYPSLCPASPSWVFSARCPRWRRRWGNVSSCSNPAPAASSCSSTASTVSAGGDAARERDTPALPSCPAEPVPSPCQASPRPTT